MRKKFIISLLSGVFLTSFLVAGITSEQIAVTAVQVKDSGAGEKIAEITIDNAILIREIKFSKKNGQAEMEFPAYVSRAGKKYPQVRILSKDALEVIQKAIDSGKSSALNKDKRYTLKYKITKFSPYNRPSSLKVFCAVAINEAIEIECRVMEGNYGPWIAWPARKSEENSSYIKQVVIVNTALRQAIEKALLKKYQDLRREKSSESFDNY